MREQPFRPVLAQSKQLATLAQAPVRKIIKCIHLVSAFGYLPKPRSPQSLRELPHIVDPELDFDFFIGRHEESISD
jgi:hypothetical protein